MRIVTYVCIGLLLCFTVSAVTLDVSVNAPNDEFYTGDIIVNVTTDTTSDIIASFNGTQQTADEVNATVFNFSKAIEYTGQLTVNATAVNDSNETDQDSQQVKLDALSPRVTDNFYDQTGFINQTNTTENGTFRVGAEVDDQYLRSSEPVQVRNRDDSSNTVTLQQDGDDWELELTPADIGCDAGTTCRLQFRATDQAGNTARLNQSIDVVTAPAQDNQTESTSVVTLHEPANQSAFDDSFIPINVTVNMTGVGDLSYCSYALQTEEENLAAYYTGESVSGGFDASRFDQTGNIYELNTTLSNVKDGIYTFNIDCDSYTASADLTVQDETSPSLHLNVSDVTETSANVTVSADEDFQLTEFVYRSGSTDIDNATSLPFTDAYQRNHTVRLDGLTADTVYFIQAVAVDRKAGLDGEDGNQRTETESFTTYGGEDVNQTTNRTSIYDELQNQTESDRRYSGLNFSGGISQLEAGTESTIGITNFDMDLRNLVVKPKERLRNVKYDITTSSNRPSWIDDDPDDAVYQYFYIQTENAPDSLINYVKVQFEVSTSWLDEHNIASDDVILYRRVGDAWEALPTSLTEEGSLYHSYEGLSPGFSVFGVAGEPSQQVGLAAADNESEPRTQQVDPAPKNTSDDQPPEESRNDTGTAWYTWIFFVFGFGLVAWLMYYGAVTYMTEDDLEDHTVLKAHVQRLEKFVDQAMQQGHDEAELRKKLIDNGWDDRLVDFVLNKR
jgi:PGF-pre-PGF domain-containing protein